MSKEDWLLFADLRYSNSDGILKEIANRVRSGSANQLFLDLLASHIEPGVQTPFGTKFKLVKTGRGGKKKMPNSELRNFLLIQRILLDENYEAVLAAAVEKFGIKRSTARDELNKVKMASERDPEHIAEHRKVAFKLKELGDPDYQFPTRDK